MMQPADRAWLRGSPAVNGVHLLEPPSDFEQEYAAVRTRERRVLNDDQVRLLPDGSALPNASEWRIREAGMLRLLGCLKVHAPAGQVLEIGCGNGWLAARMQRAGHHVVGIDPFTAELEQAARVFPDGPVFVRAQPFTPALPRDHFDAVVFAASIQYFADADAVLQRALQLVRPGGRVHVLDTILYPDAAAARAAVERSNAYFTRMGHPGMIGRYHAHQRAALMALPGARLLDRPGPFLRLRSRLGASPSPFTHLELSRP
ncbi:MAG TPA: class I SAM-dependent methyltransferase [Flavobacteriales bacterium]